MARSTDITSFTELRKQLREHILQVRETGRPLYITTNGQTDAVVLSPELYDSLADKAELLESLARVERGMADVREGRTEPAKAALRKIAADLGLDLGRATRAAPRRRKRTGAVRTVRPAGPTA